MIKFCIHNFCYCYLCNKERKWHFTVRARCFPDELQARQVILKRVRQRFSLLVTYMILWSTCMEITSKFIFKYFLLQSHPNTMHAYRRLSLSAFTCLLAGQQAVRLPLLPNTPVLLQFIFRVDDHAHRHAFAKRKHQRTDCDYCDL